MFAFCIFDEFVFGLNVLPLQKKQNLVQKINNGVFKCNCQNMSNKTPKIG